MITQTDKFRVKINTPWVSKGSIVPITFIKGKKVPGAPKVSDFPDVFEPIYKLEDGTEVCINDLVWREKGQVVKQVQFSQIHIDHNSKVFGTSEACEKWLSKNAKNIKAQALEQNRSSSFQTLKAWANKLNNLDSLSYNDLEKIRDGIQTTIKNIERV